MKLNVTKESFVSGIGYFVVKEENGSTLVFQTEKGLGAIDILNSLAWESETEFEFEDITSYFKTDDLREALLVLLGTCMYDDAEVSKTLVSSENLGDCYAEDTNYLPGIYVVNHPSDSKFEAYMENDGACFRFSIDYNHDVVRTLAMDTSSMWNENKPMTLHEVVGDLVDSNIGLTRCANSFVVITMMIDSI